MVRSFAEKHLDARSIAHIIAQGGPTDDDESGGFMEDGGDDDEDGGFDDDEDGGYEEDGGDDDDSEDGGPDDGDDEAGGMIEFGGKKNKKKKKKPGSLAAQQKKLLAKLKKQQAAINKRQKKLFGRGKCTRRPSPGIRMSFGCDGMTGMQRAIAANSNLAAGMTVTGRGVRVLNYENCVPYSAPLQPSARINREAVLSLMQTTGGVQPGISPVATANTGAAGTTAFAAISPSSVFTIGTAAATDVGRIMRAFYVGIVVMIGQPGFNSAAGTPISFSVYSTTWQSTTSSGAPTSTTTPEAASEGSFSSGTFQVGVGSTGCAAEVSFLTYQVVEAAAQPKAAALACIGINASTGTPATTVYNWFQRGLNLDVTSAPNSTSCTLRILLPGTLDWQALYAMLQRRVRVCN